MSDTIKCSCGFENHTSCSFCIKCGKGLPGAKPRKSRPVKSLGIEPPPAAEQPQKGTAERLQEVAENSGFAHKKTRSGWQVTVPVDGRDCAVHVLFDGKDTDGQDVISFLAVCEPARDDHAMSLLEHNSKLLYCAYAVRRLKKKRYVVVTSSQLAATADPEELQKILRSVAAGADRVRQVSASNNEA